MAITPINETYVKKDEQKPLCTVMNVNNIVYARHHAAMGILSFKLMGSDELVHIEETDEMYKYYLNDFNRLKQQVVTANTPKGNDKQ